MQRFHERRNRQFAQAYQLTEGDAAENQTAETFPGAKAGDWIVEQSDGAELIVMTAEDFAAHYVLATEPTAEQLEELAARVAALEQRNDAGGGQ